MSLLSCSQAGCSGKLLEFLIAEVRFESVSNFLLGIVYKSLNTGYLHEFQNQFLDFQVNYRHSIIFNDFNADIFIDTYDNMQLKNFVDSANLCCIPYRATHHLRDFGTLLDLCIIDARTKIINFGQHGMVFLSAHHLIYIRDIIKRLGSSCNVSEF